jgi:hypothetical protein
MADYHPLIARAVAGLDDNTAEARRSLYERARAALVKQLRSTTPPLSESDITRERLALEEAIRKIEAEQARRGRLERPPRASTPAEPAGMPAPPPDQDLTEAPTVTRSTDVPPTAVLADPQPPPERPSPLPVGEAPGAAASPLGTELEALPSGVAAPESDSESEADPTVTKEPVSARLEGALRNLRTRFKPGRREEVPQWPPIPPEEPPRRDHGLSEPDQVEPPFMRRAPRHEVPTSDVSANGGRDALLTDEEFPGSHADHSAEDRPRRRLPAMAVKIIIAAVVVAVLGALAVVGYREGGRMVALFNVFSGPPAPVATREVAKTQPKIEDRVGSAQPGLLPGGEQPGAQSPAVAQRVVLYEEDPADPAGKRYVGSAIWRTETVSPGPGLAPELAVKANIEIPDRGITMMFSMVRNTDPKLPASHTIDIRFNLPPNFSGGGIANVPGILMKQAEQTRGVPLAGIAVKVTDNVFLIGLSSVESDVERNTQLLKERAWFDIPIVYANGSRAILAMEKGTPGERAFNDAFTVWGRSGTAAR